MKRIDILPDDVLLEIFDFYLIIPSYAGNPRYKAWKSLVHVCRRWRILVFGSPRRLDLRLYCTPRTPGALDVWPALPLVVSADKCSILGTDSIIFAALEQSSRVCSVDLVNLADRQLEIVSAAMQVPFPELTYLRLCSYGAYSTSVPVIPDSFLGGSAPCSQFFSLEGIPFPGSPKLLLSATRLVKLWLYHIPHSGFILPEAMVALLCALSSLESFSLNLQPPPHRPDWEARRPPPPKRSILPALEIFHFQGATEYLEDLVTLIDTPKLQILDIIFLDQIDFDTQRLSQFINRAPKPSKRDEAHVEFCDHDRAFVWSTILSIFIHCREPRRRLSSVARICNPSLSLTGTVEDLYIEVNNRSTEKYWYDDSIENTLWLQLLRPFTAVKNLYLDEELAPDIAAALQELVGARMTEVLPSLQTIFVRKPERSRAFQENIWQFVEARQLSVHPISISDWISY